MRNLTAEPCVATTSARRSPSSPRKLAVRIVNGEVVRGPAAALPPRARTVGVHDPPLPPPPPTAGGAGAGAAGPGAGADAGVVVARVNELNGLEAALGLAGQTVTLPPVEFLSWRRPTLVPVVNLAVIGTGVVLCRVLGLAQPLTALGVGALLLGLVVQQAHAAAGQSAPRPAAAPARGQPTTFR